MVNKCICVWKLEWIIIYLNIQKKGSNLFIRCKYGCDLYKSSW